MRRLLPSPRIGRGAGGEGCPHRSRKLEERRRPTVLTISHAETSGRSGVAVDLEVLNAHGVRGLTAITQLSAASKSGGLRMHPVPPRFVATQIDAAVQGAGVEAVKVGLLGSWQMVAAVAGRARRRRLPNLVVDPQIAAADGNRVLGARGAELLRRQLLPRARVVIVTAREAQWLTGLPVADLEGARTAAEALLRTRVGSVVLWIGEGPTVTGLFGVGSVFRELGVRTDEPGGRDRFSATLAAHLALGSGLTEAVEQSISFLT